MNEWWQVSEKIRHIPGALHGSRFIEQPQIRPQVEALRRFLASGARVLVEVGFDHGRRLHSIALNNSDWRVVGLEVRKRRVAEAVERAARDKLSNVFPWRMDARTVFAAVLDEESVDVVDVFFPTPWWNPALRRKRLLIDALFLSDVERVLRPGGVLRIATDVDEYAERIEETLSACPLKTVKAASLAQSVPLCEQQSRREWKCEREEIPVHRWTLMRS